MIAMMALNAPSTLVHLSGVDLAIIAIYFLLVLAIGFYLKKFAKTGEDFFLAGREMTAWVAGAFGLGGQRLSIRDHGCALVLDRRDSRDGVSGHRDDAVLLHFKDAFCAGLFEAALRDGGQRVERSYVCVHDHPHVGRQHVCNGGRYGSGAWVEFAF